MNTGDTRVDSCLAEGKVWKEHSHSLMLISLYETRMRRAVEKDMAALEAMQTKRKEAYAQAQNEAIRLAQLAASEGEEYDPGDRFLPASAYGQFVFFEARSAPRFGPPKTASALLEHRRAPPTFPQGRLEP